MLVCCFFFLCSLPPQNSECSGASGLLKKISEKIICGDNQKGAFFVPMLSVAKCPLWAVGPVCAPSPWESIALHPTVGWAHPASSKFVSPKTRGSVPISNVMLPTALCKQGAGGCSRPDPSPFPFCSSASPCACWATPRCCSWTSHQPAWTPRGSAASGG